MCSTGKDLLKFFIFVSLFLRTISNISARIPLPTRLWRATFSPGEGLRFAQTTIYLSYSTSKKLLMVDIIPSSTLASIKKSPSGP